MSAQDHQHHGHEEHGAGHDHQVPTHSFADAERWSQRFDDPERTAWQKPQQVIELMAIEPGMTAVDIGAGTGYFLGWLAAAVGEQGRVLGLDVEPAMVQFMNQRAEREGWENVAARQVAPDDPGLSAGSVDRLLIVNTWHHIADRKAYAGKLHRALRDGGAVYVVDFTMESERGPAKNHRLPLEAVREDFAAAGLEVEVLEESLPDQYVVVGRKR